MNHTVIAIAIDGPAGAGKSTIARAAAEQLGFIYVDTGALYRTIGLAAYRRGIAGTDTEGIIKMLSQITVDLQYQKGVQSVNCLTERTFRPISVPRKFQCMPRRFLRFLSACVSFGLTASNGTKTVGDYGRPRHWNGHFATCTG